MFRQITFALASLAALAVADQTFELEETSNSVDAESDTMAVIIDLSLLEQANISQLQQSGFPLRVGDSMTFSVGGNPTTGYTWNLNEDEAANGAISIEKTYKSTP